MAVYHGKSGSVTFQGTVAKITQWTLNTIASIADSTAMGDGWETHEVGLTDFNASIEAIAQSATSYITDYIGVSATLRLTCSAGYFEGNAICNSLTETAGIEDVGKLSMSFEGNDADGISFT